jgi:hypothetical protein
MHEWDAVPSCLCVHTESKGKGGPTDRSSEAPEAASMSGTSSRSGMWIVVQCSGVGLLGERGSKVPSASIGELSLEIELSLALDFEYSRWVFSTPYPQSSARDSFTDHQRAKVSRDAQFETV